MKLGTKTYYKKRADALCSKIVRMRDACQWCGRRRSVQLQCAHVVGRNNHTLRFDEKNLLCLCAGCHRKAHDDPPEFITWFQKKYPAKMEYIMQNKNKITRRSAVDYKELVETLKKELKRYEA